MVVFCIILLSVLAWAFKEVTMGVCKNTNSMEGKTVVITGGSDGIGLEAAAELARRGARIVIGCRRTSLAIERIKQACPGASVDAFPLDLSSKQSVMEFAFRVRQHCSKIDVLINNAGMVGSTLEQKKKRWCSDKKHERVMATNYWGHVTLNHQLIDLVKAAGMAAAEGHHARVILVSSMAAMSGDLHSVSNGNFNLDDMGDGGLSLSMFRSLQYPNSKQAQLIYGKKLAKILSEERANVSVSVLHPGLVRTAIFDGFDSVEKFWTAFVCLLTGKSPTQGAQTTIYLATENLPLDEINGRFFMDCRPADWVVKMRAPEHLLDSFWAYTQDNL